jgi:hypothetical protein
MQQQQFLSTRLASARAGLVCAMEQPTTEQESMLIKAEPDTACWFVLLSADRVRKGLIKRNGSFRYLRAGLAATPLDEL